MKVKQSDIEDLGRILFPPTVTCYRDPVIEDTWDKIAHEKFICPVRNKRDLPYFMKQADVYRGCRVEQALAAILNKPYEPQVHVNFSDPSTYAWDTTWRGYNVEVKSQSLDFSGYDDYTFHEENYKTVMKHSESIGILVAGTVVHVDEEYFSVDFTWIFRTEWFKEHLKTRPNIDYVTCRYTPKLCRSQMLHPSNCVRNPRYHGDDEINGQTLSGSADGVCGTPEAQSPRLPEPEQHSQAS